ncbi:signal recognition particle protein [Terricaulis silvestris]|uniref:Signal recognition particle protein n=1 Tax=Terricaulis silvestris TaxID=2686094 RepID=A0A6I6MJC5_9CAUL|nr:signal recognition particle protein [Terricaulis silvestris]QGZ95355.1 p48 [Terricaulis silvestris]
MFEALSERLGGVFDKLTGRGALSEADVDAALREVRVALLEADVALPVVKDFIAKVRVEAVGENVIKAVKPGQQVIKIVHDALVETLGGDGPPEGLRVNGEPPNVIMMAGLQGSGKTTTTAKLALRLTKTDKRRVLMASLDTRRPAAMEQLATLGKSIGVDVLPIVAGQTPQEIAKRALTTARQSGHDVLILDTAGRTTLDDEMMSEASSIAQIAKPGETLLVADSLTGQDAVETAKRFHERLPLTGLVLTRADGDGRGGAALSMRAVTGLPIKFLGMGERAEALEPFDARRIAGRILGQGDIVGLVEKAVENVDRDEAEKMAKKMAKGRFDFDDMEKQLGQLIQIGGLKGVMGMLPGVQKMKNQISEASLDDKQIHRQIGVIRSMTKAERAKPDLINGKRRARIAKGSGVEVAEVNRLLKMHRNMADMAKRMGKGKSPIPGMPNMPGMPGGMGGGMRSPEQLKALGGGKPLPGLNPATGMPGLPGLPGLPGSDKKS